jgi:hypothetical protein
MNDASLTRANRLMREGRHREALAMYRRLAADGHPMAALLNANIALCERALAMPAATMPAVASLAADVIASAAASAPPAPAEAAPTRAPAVAPAVSVPAATVPAAPKNAPSVVVCLTTIQSRLQHLPQVIDSLHRQDLPPAAIHLHLSHEPYLLDTGIAADDPQLLALMAFPLLQVKWVRNTGPYRKIVPYLEAHFAYQLSRDKLFVTVDDDTLYPPDFLSRLVEAHRRHDCVVAFRGREIAVGDDGILGYAAWGLGVDRASLANLPTGKDGILYSTKYFTRDFLRLDDALALAPTADDLWIKWHCALNGVAGVILNPEACTSDYKSFPVVDYSRAYRGNSLYSSFNASSAHGKNDESVRQLERFFATRYGYDLAQLIRGSAAAGVRPLNAAPSPQPRTGAAAMPVAPAA